MLTAKGSFRVQAWDEKPYHEDSSGKLNADDVSRLAWARLPNTETLTSEQKATVISYVKSLPPTAEVIDDGDSLIVIDKAGATASLPLTRRLSTVDSQRHALQERAGQWNQLLHNGGLLMAGSGATVEAARDQASALLTEIEQDFKANHGSALTAALQKTTGSPVIAGQLAKAGTPPQQVHDRLPKPSASATPVSNAVRSTPEPGAMVPVAAVDDGGVQTPSSRRAYLFDNFRQPDTIPFRTAAIDQGYTLVTFKIHNDWESAYYNSIDMFRSVAASGNAGLAFVATHGSLENGLMLDDSTSVRFLHPDDIHWADHSSIVFLAACNSWFIGGAFPVREFIGASVCVDWQRATGMSKVFWERLDGTKDDGKKRTAGAAFSAGATALQYQGDVEPPITSLSSPVSAGDTILHVANASGFRPGQVVILAGIPSNGGRYKRAPGFNAVNVDARAGTITLDKPLQWGYPTASVQAVTRERGTFLHTGNGQTVLAPSVTAHGPTGTVPQDTATDYQVTFDAAMDTSVAAQSVIKASGECKPEIVADSVKWDGARMLRFSMQPHAKGTAPLRIPARFAVAAGNHLWLDGNTAPAGKDGVGPAGDDYVWDVQCDPNIIILTIPRTKCWVGDLCRWDADVTTGSKLVLDISGLRGGFSACTWRYFVAIDGKDQEWPGVQPGESFTKTTTLDFGPVQPGKHQLSVGASLIGCRFVPPRDQAPNGHIDFQGTIKITTNKAG